jgi:hypothetical protein
MPAHSPEDERVPDSDIDSARPATVGEVVAHNADDDRGRLRHASSGLLIVGLALAAMVMAMATSSILGARAASRGESIGMSAVGFLQAVIAVAILVSLLGKAKLRLDRRLYAEPEWLDRSIAAGLFPFLLAVSTLLLHWPDYLYLASLLGIPISFLCFLRFLRSVAEQYDRADLVRRTHSQMHVGLATVVMGVVGYLLLRTPGEALGVLLTFGVMIAGYVVAFRYARLLAEFRRTV